MLLSSFPRVNGRQVGPALVGYAALLADVVSVLEAGRRLAARSINALMTATYWDIGRRIIEEEQSGETRARYGEELIDSLSKDLTNLFGRGFGRRNLFQMRAFYLAYRHLTRESSASSLTQSHDVRLLAIQNRNARAFYEAEALRVGLRLEYSESELEAALISRLETFLLELGGDFTFAGRQRRLRIGDDLILCAQKDSAVARYALEGLPNKVLAAEYRMALPDEQTLAAEVDRTRRLLERRRS